MLMSVDYEKEHGADSRNGLPAFCMPGKGKQMARGYVTSIYIDTSDVQSKVDLLRRNLSEEKTNQILFWTCDKTSKKVKKILKKDLPMDYHAKPAWITSAVGKPKIGSSAGINCIIPLKGVRGTIGGKQFSAKGGAHGWKSVGRKYRIHAKIVKSGESTLPPTLADQGGNPPFRNYSAPTLHNAAFTRTTDARLPIVPVSGLAVPQMPLNLSRERVEDDILAALSDQLDYYVNRYIFP